MTLIDKAEALRIVMEECYKDREMKLATRIEERIAALHARGVGVKALDDLERFSAREIAEFAEKYEAEDAERWLDYQHVYAALAPTDAAQAPFRMEDMTLADLMRDPLYEAATAPAPDAAQAREAHLREAAAAVRARYMGDNNREDQEVLRCEAAILALIGERP